MDYTDEELLEELSEYLDKRTIVISTRWVIDGFLMEDRHVNERLYVGKKGAYYLDCHTLYSENVHKIEKMEDYVVIIMSF